MRPTAKMTSIGSLSLFLAHLSLRLIGEVIVYPCSGICRRPSKIANTFFSQTTWLTNAKLYMDSPLEEVTKVYINGPGHIAKMAAMPIYGINPLKPPEPKG